MTIICVKKSKDYIEIVSDSQSTCGGFSFNCFDKKIIKYGENSYIVSAGLLTDIKKFKRLFSSVDFNEIKSLKDFDELIDGFVGQNLEVGFIAVIKNKVYCFEFYDNGKYNSYEVNDFCAIGSGYHLATMGYEFTDNLVKIVENVIKHDTGCGGKIVKKKINI